MRVFAPHFQQLMGITCDVKKNFSTQNISQNYTGVLGTAGPFAKYTWHFYYFRNILAFCSKADILAIQHAVIACFANSMLHVLVLYYWHCSRLSYFVYHNEDLHSGVPANRITLKFMIQGSEVTLYRGLAKSVIYRIAALGVSRVNSNV